MEKYFEFSHSALLTIVLTGIGIYIAVIIFTRITGKRSFSKMSSFDFAMTVAIGSIIATTLLSSTISLIEGIAGLATVYILQLGAAFLRRYAFFEKAIGNTPLLLMDGENILHDNLRRAKLTEGDLKSKLREANVIRLTQVKAVVFEATGDVSVLHSDDAELEDWLLKDVKR